VSQYPPLGWRQSNYNLGLWPPISPGFTPFSSSHAPEGTSPRVGIEFSGQCTRRSPLPLYVFATFLGLVLQSGAVFAVYHLGRSQL